MTARQLFEYTLIELNKVQAPSLLLEDYNYFINKAIITYADKRYSLYEITQQLTDDLGVLSMPCEVNLTKKTSGSIQSATFTGVLPQEYFHILDCVVEFTYLKKIKCNDIGTKTTVGVKKLKSGMTSGLLNNYYFKPSLINPYYYLHNSSMISTLTDGTRVAEDRKGFPTTVKIELRYGKDDDKATATKLYVDYLKVPKYIILTQDQIDADLDESQIMEFPDYVCYEIIKELVALLMENASDPRLNTNIPINQAIASGAQQQKR